MPLRSMIPSRKKWLPSPSESQSRAGSITQSPLAKRATRIYAKLKGLGSKESASKASGSYFQCNGAGTDIFSLPVELLVEIFLLVHDDIERAFFPFHRVSIPLNLTQTCRLWRAISLGTPQLWTTFSVCLDISPKNLELWIERANGHPLRLDLSHFDAAGSKDMAWAAVREATLWDIIRLHASQLEHLYFAGAFQHSTLLSSLQPGMFSGLKSVDWSTIHQETYPTIAQIYEGFWENACSAPLLQKATMWEIPEKAPWSQFTELDLADSPLLSIIRALPQCQNLTKLSWCHMYDDVSYVVPTPILLPKLLKLSVSGGVATESLFNCLCLPSLSQLAVRCFDDTISQSLHGLLARSNATLRYIRALTNTQTLLRLLDGPLLSDLCCLSISVLKEPKAFWTALANPAFLPCLQELQLGIHQDNNLMMNLIENSFRIRQDSAPPGRENIHVVVSMYDPRPSITRTNMEKKAEILRRAEAWSTLSKKLENYLVLTIVDIVPFIES